MGPPEDVPASELFLALQQARPSEVVNFPRKTADGKPVGTVRIQVLGMKEHDRARKTALEKAKTALKLSREDMDSPLGAALISDAVARELLFAACLTEAAIAGADDRYARVFPTSESIAEFLSADEVAVLFNCYLLVQAKWGPFEKTIETEEELSQWVKRLVEGAAGYPLRHLSSVHWADVAYLLARRAFLLSGILDSLFKSLPPSLASRLGTFSLGTGFYLRPALGSPAESTATSDNPEAGSDSSLRVLDVEITIEDARDMALRMKDAEEGALAVLDEADRNRDI